MKTLSGRTLSKGHLLLIKTSSKFSFQICGSIVTHRGTKMAMKKVGNILNMSSEKTSKVNKRFDRAAGNRFSLYKQTDATLNASFDMKDLVKLPEDEDINDFLATHVVDFYNRAKVLYSTIVDTNTQYQSRPCSEENCPTMSGGPKYEYLWQDEVRHKKPVSLSAPEYIVTLIEWIDDILQDEKIFPPVDDVPFPKNFRKTCSKIFRRLYRIFVHIYIEHFDR